MLSARMHWGWLAVGALLIAGCDFFKPSPDPAKPNPPETKISGSTTTGTEPKSTGTGSQTPDESKSNRLEPYDAPPLAELDAKAGWEDQPLVDPMKVLRAMWETEKPLATIQEALHLENTSPENNAKILYAFGQLPKSDGDVNWDASIARHLRADVKSTNPVLISSSSEFDLTELIGFGLFTSNYKMQTVGSSDAMVSWQVSQDHLMDKVVMRKDLTWSDGHPITAHDVVFSFKTIMDPDVLIPAVRSGTDKLRWVEAYDDYTLVFFHKEALATNPGNVSFPIIPQHIYEKSVPEDKSLTRSDYHLKYEDNPVVGGVYVIAKRVRGQEMLLSRRESYYMHEGKQVRDKPFFKDVRLRIIEDSNTSLLALNKSEIDELVLRPEQWIARTKGEDFYKNNTKARATEWTYFYFGWNQHTPYFEDVRVRKAMSYAFDYKEMLDNLCYGLYEPSAGPFHPTAWYAPHPSPAPYHQDLDKAEALLDEAGWIDSDGDGIRDHAFKDHRIPFEFTMLCMNDPERIAYCTLLKLNLEKIGVICNVKPLEFVTLQEKTQNHEFQANFGGWGASGEPDSSCNVFDSKETRNFGFYSNTEVDRLYQAGRKEFNQEKRAEIYSKIAELIYADQPYTFLYYRGAFYGLNKQLRGYYFSPRGPFHYGPGFSSFWMPRQDQ